MIRLLSLISFFLLLVINTPVYSQEKSGPFSHAHYGSIGISYEIPSGLGGPVFTAVLSNNIEAVNGKSFNGGSAMVFKVHSDRSYNIRIAAENAAGSDMNSSLRPIDIRDYIFFRIVDNNTGGFTQVSGADPDGERLGNTEKSIITNCPPTFPGYHVEDQELYKKTFSLVFKLKAGYSLPPGNYVTSLLITATYD